MRTVRRSNLIAIIPLLMILLQVGFAAHIHSSNSYHDDSDCFHGPTIQCTMEKIDLQAINLEQVTIQRLPTESGTSITPDVPSHFRSRTPESPHASRAPPA